MDQYFIDRTHKKLLELAAQNPKDKIEFAYFVDEKIDHKHDRTDDDATDLSHLIINNSTFSNIGFKKLKRFNVTSVFVSSLIAILSGQTFSR